MSKKPQQQIIAGTIWASEEETAAYRRLVELSKQTPIPDKELLANLGLYLNRGSLSRILFMHNLYLKILKCHGIIIEFGVRWGQNMALFTTFRHIYEPYNFSRKIVGFDTFEGFPSVTPEDGAYQTIKAGSLNVTPHYENFLEEILSTQEKLAPRNHIKKYELVKGDVTDTLQRYLDSHPETVIALAYFDLDLYKPTKTCLELIGPYLAKNSVVGFDELLLEEAPGETQALREAWGTSGYRVVRDPISPQQSYIVFDDCSF
jgi:hypothetical protein